MVNDKKTDKILSYFVEKEVERYERIKTKYTK